MTNWEYCEVEVTLGWQAGAGKTVLTVFNADGKHEQFSGDYGQIFASIGAQGWELVASSAHSEDGLAKRHRINYIFKRPLRG